MTTDHIVSRIIQRLTAEGVLSQLGDVTITASVLREELTAAQGVALDSRRLSYTCFEEIDPSRPELGGCGLQMGHTGPHSGG